MRKKKMLCPYCHKKKAKVDTNKLGLFIQCGGCRHKIQGFDTLPELVGEWRELKAIFKNLEKNGHNPRKEDSNKDEPITLIVDEIEQKSESVPQIP